MKNGLVVSTHLKNIRQNGFIFPHFWDENNKYLSCHHLEKADSSCWWGNLLFNPCSCKKKSALKKTCRRIFGAASEPQFGGKITTITLEMTSCWWFRNPKANHRTCMCAPLQIMGYLPHQLVSLPDFWSINGNIKYYCTLWCKPNFPKIRWKKTRWFDQNMHHWFFRRFGFRSSRCQNYTLI